MKAYMPAWSLNCAGANSIHADLVIILLAMIKIYCDDDDETIGMKHKNMKYRHKA